MSRFLLLICLFPLVAFSQKQANPIYWQNASFEGEPQDATVPIGWLACEPFTTPDILPGFWGIFQEASEGETYVGLITRENGTWESITQRLPRTINRGDCYTFTLDLAHGVTYSGYNQTLKLRIWGSTNKCTKNQLLFESPLIDHPEWRPYRVEFTAKQPVRYILIEAFYQEGSFRRKGNILIDNLSPLRWCPRA
jgi:hypothetical protein